MFSFNKSLLYFSNLIITVLLLNCLTLLPAPASAAETVRVGMFPLGNFMYLDDKNIPRGYNIDYLNLIADETHWKYQYVTCHNWAEAISLLETDQIDLLAPAQIINEYRDRFRYPVYRMGVEYAAVYTLKENSTLVYEDFNTMSTLRYGAVKGSGFTRKFKEFSQEKGFTPNITNYYTNTTDLFDALLTHKVDAVVANLLFDPDPRLKILSRFTPEASYFITTPDKQYLLQQLDNTVRSINNHNPDFMSELIQKNLPHYNQTETTFEEYKFIQSMPEITVGVLTDSPPISYIDHGELTGITTEIIKKISAISGFKFKFVPISSEQFFMAQDKPDDLNVDIIAYMRSFSLHTVMPKIMLSHPYLNTAAVFVANNRRILNEDLNMRVAAIDRSDIFQQIFKQHYPNFTLEIYNSPLECFEAVKDGRADLLLLNQHYVSTTITNPRFKDMNILPIQNFSNGLAMAVISNPDSPNNALLTDKRFMSVLNKSIDSLSEQDINFIIYNQVNKNLYKYTFIDFLSIYQHYIFLALLAVITAIFLLNHLRHLETIRAAELDAKNAQLETAVQQADNANKAKSQFLSSISHEIRTPMNAIVGITTIAKNYLQGAVARQAPEALKIDKCLDKINISSRTLLNIINDVLDMSAIEQAKLKIAHAEFNMHELLNGLSIMYEMQCKTKGQTFIIDDSGLTKPWLVGDSLRINQILLNLISNAYKFTDAGGKITVTASQTPITGKEQQLMLKLTVSDTGIGISQEMQERLFKPFEQENATTAQKYGGSGLGMSITANLTKLMNGMISVQSAKDIGTTFTVLLPMEISAAHSAEEVSESAALPDDFDFTGYKILLAEDNMLNKEIATELLLMVNMQSDWAADGAAAVQQFTSAAPGTYNAILMDIQMPKLNGYEAAQAIRHSGHAEATAIPIIAMTANAFAEDIDNAKKAGMNDHIAKPIDNNELYSKLAKYIIH